MTSTEGARLNAILTMGYVLLSLGVVSTIITFVLVKRDYLKPRPFWSTAAVGTVLGVILCFFNAYDLSSKVSVTGFPFPTAIFVQEDGHWVDYINSHMPLVLLGNFIVGVGILQIPLVLVLLVLRIADRRGDESAIADGSKN